MSGKKNRKELTATECRQDAGERVKKLKSQWTIFLRTGLVVTAAAIAVIVGTIAWFMANDKVGGTGTKIRASGSVYDLAAEGTDVADTKGRYDGLLDTASGDPVTLNGVSYIATNDDKNSITWAITSGTNMRNEQDTGRGIEPGSAGSMTFYIIPHKDGPLSVQLELSLIGYSGDETAVNSGELTKIGPSLQQLLEGHLLLFAGYDPDKNTYKGWISEDASIWTLSLDSENTIFLTRDESGRIVWTAEKVEKDTAYPVTIYWIWPEMLESYLMKPGTYTGKRPLLFPGDTDTEHSSDPETLPDQLYKTMCEEKTSVTFNRYFRWENISEFREDVTPEKLANLRKSFNPVIYGTIAAYYNSADQYLGENVRYVKLKLDTR